MRRSLSIVREMADREAERGRSAERRSESVLVAVGVLAGFVTLVAQSLTAPEGPELDVLVGGLFAIVVGLLAKAGFYALRVNGVLQTSLLNHELARTIQHEDEIGGLRSEIAWRQWEIDEQVPINTHKLFWLARAQRNTICGLVVLLGLGIAIVFQDRMTYGAVQTIGWFVLITGVAILVILDAVAEQRGFWMWHW